LPRDTRDRYLARRQPDAQPLWREAARGKRSARRMSSQQPTITTAWPSGVGSGMRSYSLRTKRRPGRCTDRRPGDPLGWRPGVAMTRCACHARAAAATPSPSIRRRPRAFAPIWRPRGTAPTLTGRCSGRCTTTASVATRAGAWTRTRSIARRGCPRHASPGVVRKYATELGLDRGYSAHSMRATFITTALENGAQLEDVQKAAGHRDPGTTKLYDRRGYNPEKAASFFAT
jgi:hypothetical protein